jgi:hypothetical protein
MGFRETILEWMDQFENDHYEFDVYGRTGQRQGWQLGMDEQ